MTGATIGGPGAIAAGGGPAKGMWGSIIALLQSMRRNVEVSVDVLGMPSNIVKYNSLLYTNCD